MLKQVPGYPVDQLLRRERDVVALAVSEYVPECLDDEQRDPNPDQTIDVSLGNCGVDDVLERPWHGHLECRHADKAEQRHE